MYCSPYALATFRWKEILRYEYVLDGSIIYHSTPTIVIQFEVSFQSLNETEIIYLGYTNSPYSFQQSIPLVGGEVKNVPVENLFCGRVCGDYESALFLEKYPDSKIPSVHYYNNNGDVLFSSIRRFRDYNIYACTFQKDLRETLWEFVTNTAPWHFTVTHCCLHSNSEILPFVEDMYTPKGSDFLFDGSLPCGSRSLSLVLEKVDLFFTKCSDIPEYNRASWQANSDFTIDFDLGVIFTVTNGLYRFKSHFISSPDFHASNAYVNGYFDNRPTWVLSIEDYVDVSDYQHKMGNALLSYIESWTSFPVLDVSPNYYDQFSPFSYKTDFLKRLEFA